jgi:hypothetical protein
MSRSTLKPSRRVRPAAAKPERCVAPKYPRPPVTDGNVITREAKAMYRAAWQNLTKGTP